MYSITGTDQSGNRVTVATVKSPGDALSRYREAQNDFRDLIVTAPDGSEIDGFELSARYTREQQKMCE